MKIMVFDVGGTEIKYSVMDEQMHRTNSGAVPRRKIRRRSFWMQSTGCMRPIRTR